jgi:hypothetical protein
MQRRFIPAAIALLLAACTTPTLPAGWETPPLGLRLRADGQDVTVGNGLSAQWGGANGSAIYLTAGEGDDGPERYQVQMSLIGRQRLSDGFTKADLTAAGCQASVNRSDGLYLWISEGAGLEGLTLQSSNGRLTAVWQGRLKPAEAGTVAKQPLNVDVGFNVAFADIKEVSLLTQHLRWFAGLPR